MRQATTLLLVLAAAAALAAPSTQPGKASTGELRAQLDQVAAQLKNATDNIKVVETQYSERPDPTDEELQKTRFSEGEIQYLLGDYAHASVLFYDLVADKRFKRNARYPDALYYLCDALYQQKNFVGAKLYLRELMSLKGPHYKEALLRYLEIAGRLNEFANIDEYINQARGLTGELTPDILYVYGKWMFKRGDLPLEERVKRAEALFGPLAEGDSPFKLQARYFLGVGAVKVKSYDAAIEQFQRLLAAPASGERAAKVRELAHLSMGRVLYEIGKFDEALDQYREIPRESEYFEEAFFEIAWTYVKKGDYEKALRATEVVELGAENSVLAPENHILQAHLLLKLKKYDDATATYNRVINTYGPVRDEIEALLTANKDPVKYFDDLLSKNERNLDVTALLPEVARKWATTQQEVATAVRMVGDLEAGRYGVTESQEIAGRLLKAIDERGVELFPAMQEGYARADAIDSQLTGINEELVRLEGYAMGDALSADEKTELAKLRQEEAELKRQFDQLPTSETDLAARKRKMRERVDGLDKAAFKLETEIQSYFAQITAMRKFVDDTRAQRKNSPEDEKAFLEKVRLEEDALAAMQKELGDLRRELVEVRAGADTVLSGEDLIRKKYEDSVARQHELLAKAESRTGPEVAKLIEQAHQIRDQGEKVRTRVTQAKSKIRDQVVRRGQLLRELVASEQALLSTYANDVTQVSGEARNLVGKIAFDSFGRVHRQFYDLVLKADVGAVDVAFTRKQDKTQQIQKLASQKDRELKALDEEFREVLKDVD